MIKKIIFFTLILFAFKGCTKDDICPPDTATTSNLIITFRDFANPANPKKVEVLTVQTDNNDSIDIIYRISTDSIIIPLNTNADTTKYRLIRTVLSDTGSVVSENIDKIMFIYNRRNGYVNRACGFKTEFDNLEPVLELEGSDNWIEQVIRNRDTVNDENSAHITLLH